MQLKLPSKALPYNQKLYLHVAVLENGLVQKIGPPYTGVLSID